MSLDFQPQMKWLRIFNHKWVPVTIWFKLVIEQNIRDREIIVPWNHDTK